MDALDTPAINVVAAAYQIAWQFLEADPGVQTIPVERRRNVLAASLVRTAGRGELHKLILANHGIMAVRRFAAPHVRGR
jgi:hypothetical protein